MLNCLTCKAADEYESYFVRLQYGVKNCNDYITNVKIAQILNYLETIKTEDCVEFDPQCLLEKLNCS